MLLMKIRTLLLTLSKKELLCLEKMLCSCEEPGIEWNCVEETAQGSDAEAHVSDPEVHGSVSGSDSSIDSPKHAATPPPTPQTNQGFFMQNRVRFYCLVKFQLKWDSDESRLAWL